MATRTYSAERLDPRVTWVQWTGLTQASTDDGARYGHTPGVDRSVHITGTPGVGGTVVIEGSNLADPAAGTAADWVTLTDPQGNALSFTAIGRIEQISEVTRWIRPRVTGGDGTTNFTVSLLQVGG